MNIAFNLLPYSPGSHGGAEFYLHSVVSALSQLMDNDIEITLLGDRKTTHAYREAISKSAAVVLPDIYTRNRANRIFAEQSLLPLVCTRNKIDCIVSNYVSPILAPVPQVVIVHDMLFRRYPALFERSKLYYWKAMIPASLSRSASVVTVSQFSASEIVEFYPAVRSKLFVTVEGIRSSLLSTVAQSSTQNPDLDKYLMCVATFGRHKNLHTLIKAVAALPARHADIKLALIGAARTPEAKAYQAELKQLIADLGLASRVVFSQHVSDEELSSLYRRATALIIPSLYEGFGLPILEAQHFGCPVLCSNAASLPEVAGPAAITFDPTNVASVTDSIIELLDNPVKGDELRRLGRENTKRFSWKMAAQQLATAIEFACKG